MPEPTKTAIDPRHTARVLALQQLFNHYSVNKDKLETTPFSAEELKELYEQEDYNVDLYEAIVAGVKEHQAIIDKTIEKLAPLWPLAQVSLIDLIVLRLGIWECFVAKRVPEKVGIDEAIELAKEFSGEASGKFVNGVLGNLLKDKALQEQILIDTKSEVSK